MDCKWKKQGCGGCGDPTAEYAALLAEKQRSMIKLLGKFGAVSPILGAEDPTHYRCKVISSFGTANGRLINGLYARNSHRILPIRDCMLEDSVAAAAAEAACKATAQCKYTAYDEDRGTGLLRHVLIRRGAATGQLMVVLITAQSILPGAKNFVSNLRRLCPAVTTVVQNVNRKSTSAVLGTQFKTLWGPGYIEDELCGCRFIISPGSFYQVNPAQTEKLYSIAVKAASLTPQETVLDAYCGTGTIGLVAAKQSGCSVIGVESNRFAVQDALKNAKRNQISNARFIAADAGAFMQQMAHSQEKAPDVVFMDPPRAGSDEAFLSALCSLAPKRVVYISCNPETQARDLEYLVRNNYRVTSIQPVDLFPFTEHTESIVLLSREKADDYVRISVNTKDLHMRTN